MSTVKLTLSAEKPLVEEAKRLARARHTSVSAMFARFLGVLTADRDESERPLAPITRRASGMVRLPQSRSDRELLEDGLNDRFGVAE